MASKNQEFGDLEKRWAIVPEGSGICRGCLPTEARERRRQEEGRAKKAAYRNFLARIEKIHHPRMICYRLRLVIENRSLFYCNKLTRSIPMNTVVSLRSTFRKTTQNGRVDVIVPSTPIRKKPLAIILAALFGAFGSGVAHAQEDASPSPASSGGEAVLPTVNVSGSSGGIGGAYYSSGNTDIIRTEVDAQPYTIIDRQKIENSSATTVEELLRQTMTMSTSVSGETASGWTGSSSQINLRGLGTSHTLVLINGRRGAGVGSRGASEVSDQQNINNIPLAAIERIEILPVSASAIYGASAIGGVVNVVLRRDYVGTEINARYGDTFDTDASIKNFNFVSGASWDEGRTRLMVTAQKQQQNALQWRDRDFAEKGRARILARDPQSIYGVTNPPYGNLVNIKTKDGSPLYNDGNPASFTYIPSGYQGVAIDGLQPLLDNRGQYALGLPNAIASFSSATAYLGNSSGLTGYVGESETDAFTLSLTRDFSNTFNAFLDVSYDHNRVESAGTYHGFGVVTISRDAPNNPFGKELLVAYPINYKDGIRQANSVITNQTTHMALGFNWQITPKWLLSADYAYSRTRNNMAYQRRPATSTSGCAPVNITGVGNSIRDCLTQALNDGTLDVLRDTSSYATEVSPYWAKAPNFTEQKLRDTNLRAAGTLASWYAGDINLATGIGHRRFWSEGQAEYTILSNPKAATTIREQNASSLYAELTVPFIAPNMQLPWARLLEMQIAARHERFDNTTVGTRFDATMPTIGFRFAPHPAVMLRASWGKGFLTPSVSQLTPPTIGITPTNITDPQNGLTYGIATLGGGNPDIEPEESKSANIGFVLTPAHNLRLSVDYYKIKKTNNITTLSAQNLLDNESQFGDRITRDPVTGEVTQINTSPFNGLWLETSGIDTSLNYFADTAIGDLTVNLGYTYVDKYLQQLSFGAKPVDYLNQPSSGPLRHRFNASAYLKINNNWSAGWGVQYYGQYRIAASSTAAIKQQERNKVAAQAYHDVFARYVLPHHFLGQKTATELTFGVKNLFNESSRDMSQTTYLSIYSDPRGRQFYTNLKVSF
jgi:outer membrane receptor protein involved in Fe transport